MVFPYVIAEMFELSWVATVGPDAWPGPLPARQFMPQREKERKEDAGKSSQYRSQPTGA